MKRAILILGPPRSGTSVVSHIISELGVNFGNHNSFLNPFEIKPLNDLNDKIFEFFGKKFTSFNWLPAIESFNDTIIKKFESRIETFIQNEFGNHCLIGLKDPRFCFTLPLWDRILKHLNFDVTYILTRRSSSSIFESNRKINKYSVSANFNLVVHSTLLAQHFIADKKHLIVKYENLLSNPTPIIRQIYNKIGLDHVLVNKASSVIRQELNNHFQNNNSVTYHYFNNVLDAEIISSNEILHYRELMLTADDNKQLDWNAMENQIIALRQVIQDLQNSLSWRLMQPARYIGRKLKMHKIKKIFSHGLHIIKNFKKLIYITRQAIIYNKLGQYLRLLDSDNHRQELAQLTGLSFPFLNSLNKLINQALRFKLWLDSKLLKKKYFKYLIATLAGEKVISINKIKNQIQFYLEHPRGLIKIVNKTFILSGWCVNFISHSHVNVRVKIGKVIYQTLQIPREEIERSFDLLNKVQADVGFASIPIVSIGLHRMRIEVEVTKNHWVPVHRSFLLRFPHFSFKSKSKKISYGQWNDLEKEQLDVEMSEIKDHILVMIEKPFFTIIIDIRDTNSGHDLTVKSIQEQIYPHHEILLYNPSPDFESNQTLNRAVTCGDNARDPVLIHSLNFCEIKGDFIVFLKNGQCLNKNALYQFANVLNQAPTIDLIYGDEDDINHKGIRTNPFYKPDWSPDYLEVFNYISFPACFRTKIARADFKYDTFYDFVLRFTERTAKIHHIAMVLGHTLSKQFNNECLDKIASKNIVALQGRLDRTGREGTVFEHSLYRGCYLIKQNLKNKPLVSIIIPTAGKCLKMPSVSDNNEKKDLIINIVNQIYDSTYDNLEIIIVDNGDLTSQQIKALDDKGCKRITYKEPRFNISKKFNLGASIALGDFFLLMNDDIEILSNYWLERMLAHFEKPHVGVVGGKLLYPNKKTQHVGVVQNEGGLYHVRQHHHRNEAGYYFSTCGVRNFIAVTGAVMLTLADLYRSVGGYSEDLAVSFNDIDFCLKIREKGFFIVYAPEVELIHMESASRVPIADIQEVMLFQKKWTAQMITDPFYNEQFLTTIPPTFVPCINERKI